MNVVGSSLSIATADGSLIYKNILLRVLIQDHIIIKLNFVMYLIRWRFIANKIVNTFSIRNICRGIISVQSHIAYGTVVLLSSGYLAVKLQMPFGLMID